MEWDWKAILFSFEGRLNRAKYWLVSILTGVFWMVFFLLAMLISGVLGDSAVAVGFLAGIPLFIASVWAGIATGVKRLHDREKSGAWLLLFYLVPGVLQAIGDSGGGLFFVLIGFVISIWGFVEMGCLKGTTGPNGYGADPIPDEAVPQAGTGS